VNLTKIIEFLSTISTDINQKDFFVKIYSFISQHRKRILSKDADNLRRVCTEEYDELSRMLDFSKLQESCAVRNILKARRLANLLINDKGVLNTHLLNKTILLLTQNLYFLGPDRQYDSIRQEHLLRALKNVQERQEIQNQIKNIGKPYSNKIAEQMILDTLQLPEKTVVTDAHARRAALFSLICYLRQNVGSCFATAPCIVVHEEQPLQFLKDINELISTGRLKRTWGGVEYSVPLSPSWGAGDLKKMVQASLEELSHSPGLVAAFEAIQVLNSEDPTALKYEQVFSLLSDITQINDPTQKIVVSAEDLIRKVLLRHNKITERDLFDYQQRPSSSIQTNLIVSSPQIGLGSGGVGQACALYLVQYEVASKAFRSLSDNALLKAWEFTVASFAENKAGFTRWNLYSSLGLGPQEKGGIGECLYKFIHQKLEETNEKLRRLNEEHEQIYAQVKYMESRIRHASEKESQWLRAEYQSKRNEFYTFEELKNKTQMKASRYANLFNTLISSFDSLFPQYFQEVYDADMQDVSSSPYDDSPAGFRLIYKFGRSNSSSWQRIYTPNQFIEALANFFSITESAISSSDSLIGFEEDYGEIVTAIINHVRTQEFLETAFFRMAAAHHTPIVKNPLDHLDQIEKKPWSYTSGGSMDTLVTAYFKREIKPAEMSRWVESPIELLVFLADILKQSPPTISQHFLDNPNQSMLMQSPTHAFTFKPGQYPFKEAWLTDAFTYTWVRDHLVKPMEKFVDKIELNKEMIEYLIHVIAEFIPSNYQHFFKKNFSLLLAPMSTKEFRSEIIEGLKKELGLRSGGRPVLSSDLIDGVLFSLLPMFPIHELHLRVFNVLNELKDIFSFNEQDIEKILDAMIRSSPVKLITAEGLQNICKALICLTIDNTCTSVDFHKHVSEACRKLDYVMPRSILFADTNWMKDYFSFVVNPGNGLLELWRVDILSTKGSPMSMWEHWLNGSQRQAQWGVYTRPYEYTF